MASALLALLAPRLGTASALVVAGHLPRDLRVVPEDERAGSTHPRDPLLEQRRQLVAQEPRRPRLGGRLARRHASHFARRTVAALPVAALPLRAGSLAPGLLLVDLHLAVFREPTALASALEAPAYTLRAEIGGPGSGPPVP